MSIGDLFGSELADFFEPEPEQQEAGSHAEVVTRIAQSLGGPDQGPATRADSLASLGIQGLALWALVDQLERELNVSVSDAEVRAWQSLADVTATLDRLAEPAP